MAASPSSLNTQRSLPQPVSAGNFNSTNSTAEYVKEVSSRRMLVFVHFKHVFEGKTLYLQSIRLKKEDVQVFYEKAKMKKRYYLNLRRRRLMGRRTMQWYVLGYSLANLLEIQVYSDYLRSLQSLLTEYELWVSGSNKPRVIQLLRITAGRADANALEGEEGLFAFLDIPNLPFDIDYLQTFYSLADLIILIYQKFLHINSSDLVDSSFLDTFNKIDVRFKKIIGIVQKEAEMLSRPVFKEEVKKLDASIGRGSNNPGPEEWDFSNI